MSELRDRIAKLEKAAYQAGIESGSPLSTMADDVFATDALNRARDEVIALLDESEPVAWRCEGCGEHVEPDHGSLGHTRTVTDPDGNALPAACGPVTLASPTTEDPR